MGDVWAVGDAYERYMGRWSRLVARDFLDWLALPAKLAWLDIGCGVGALTSEILARAAPASVAGLDSSEGFLGHARERIPDANASFHLGDAQALPFANAAFDVAVSGLVLNFMRFPERAERAMATGTVKWFNATLWGFPCCARFPCARAAASTPVQRLGVVFAHLTQPYQPSPKLQSGRPAHRPFRGLLSVHSRCGPHTRAVTYT